MYLSIYLSVYRSVYPSIYLSTYRSIHTTVYMHYCVYLSVYPSILLPLSTNIHLTSSMYLSIYLSTRLSMYLHTYPLIFRSIRCGICRLTIYLSIYLSIYLAIDLNSCSRMSHSCIYLFRLCVYTCIERGGGEREGERETERERTHKDRYLDPLAKYNALLLSAYHVHPLRPLSSVVEVHSQHNLADF